MNIKLLTKCGTYVYSANILIPHVGTTYSVRKVHLLENLYQRSLTS